MSENIKVYFASCDKIEWAVVASRLGIRYALWTCFPFLARVFGLSYFSSPVTRWCVDETPRRVPGLFKSSILDSGIFTITAGVRAGTFPARLLTTWYDKYIEFILNNDITSICVEFDCQKILDPYEAWEYRKRMRRDLPQNRQINVFHIEDGRRGLDRLIEFSDYIAIAALEWRALAPLTWKRDVVGIAKYIKSRKSSIDIHLLGCTVDSILRKASFCTSCDSSSWALAGSFRRSLDGGRIREEITGDDAQGIRRRVDGIVAELESLTGKTMSAGMKKAILSVSISALTYKAYYSQVAGSQE